MVEKDKLRIKRLDEKADYALWRSRVEAACFSKGLEDVLQNSNDRKDTSEEHKTRRLHSSNIIVSAFSDAPLRVVRNVIGEPVEMMEKLDVRYDSKSTASKI